MPRRASTWSSFGHSSSGRPHGSSRNACWSARASSRKWGWALDGPCPQWRKCRRPVKTIVAPAFSTASITSWSRFEPPGWTIDVRAGVERDARPVGEREERIGGERRSRARSWPNAAAFSTRDAHRVDAAHLSGADADRREVLARARSRSTRRACTRASAKTRSPHCRSSGVPHATCQPSRSSISVSGSWTSRPPRTRL